MVSRVFGAYSFLYSLRRNSMMGVMPRSGFVAALHGRDGGRSKSASNTYPAVSFDWRGPNSRLFKISVASRSFRLAFDSRPPRFDEAIKSPVNEPIRPVRFG